MMQVPHEILAIQGLGLIAVFFEERWNHWDFFQKCSLLLWHWTAIIEAVKTEKPATLFRVPSEWSKKRKLNRLIPAALDFDLCVGAVCN
jgi:hypothetical protein